VPRSQAGRKDASILKKRSKKRLFIWASAFPVWAQPSEQKFFGSFFQKRTAFLSLALPFRLFRFLSRQLQNKRLYEFGQSLRGHCHVPCTAQPEPLPGDISSRGA
jgi:hypothetical protein